MRLCIIAFALLASFRIIHGSSFMGNTEDILSERVRQLLEWTQRRSVIRLNSEKFKSYVKGQPRNYSVILMLTTLSPQRECQICKSAYEEFQIVANSFRYAEGGSSRLFFSMVDYDDGAEIFRMLKQKIAPVFIHFPPKGMPKKGDQLDISRLGFAAETLSRWIQERTDIHIRIFRPPNYTGTMLLALCMSMGAALLYFRRNNLDFLYNRTSWAIMSLMVIFAMLSGQMWNHIRGPPMLHANPQTGHLMFIYPSGDFQFVAETFIVLFLYISVGGGLLLLHEASKVADDSGKRKMMALGGLGLFAIFFSFILSVFRGKYQGYPYSFLIK